MTYSLVPANGGLDLVTSPIAVQPGRLIDCQNYEVGRQRGYRRMDGYEPYDGGPSPSYFQLVNIVGNRVGGSLSSTYAVGKTIQLILTAGGPPIFFYITQAANFTTGGPTIFHLNITGFVIPAAYLLGVYTLGQRLPSYNTTLFSGTLDLNGLFPVFITGMSSAMGASASAFLTASQTSYAATAALVQQVPGQGNVNGLFWLKDKLYAVRDYFAANFNTGTIQPNLGDVLYVGASFGAATWTGSLAKISLTSGSWTGLSAGNAAGVFMVYNTSGTLNAGDTINNNTTSTAAIATADTSGAGNALSTAAGMYVAQGGRGSGTKASWQWCDLGWTIQYKTGVVDFVDLNVALTQALSPQYVTTGWKTATTGSNAGWNLQGGTWPGVLTTAADSQYAYHDFFSGGSKATSGTFTLTGFGFTASDIPSTASIIGIEIQMISAAQGLTGSFTAAPIDKTLQLLNVTRGPTPNLASSTTYTVNSVATDSGSTTASYNFALRDIGAPTTVPNTPTSSLGYTGIQGSDILSPNFGISYAVTLSGTQTNQHIHYAVDQIRMRITFLPETNAIYFWNGTSAVRAQIVQHYQQSGSLPSGNAAGTLYIQFISASGVVGGTPSRTVGANETIRTYPSNGTTPDGGTADGSTLLATSASSADLNVMDWSALLTGVPQPSGVISPPSKYQSVTKNFYASQGLEAIFGVSGGGPAFYFDGIKTDSSGATVPGHFSRIFTGLPTQFETPRSIAAHQGHIILGYYAGFVYQSDDSNTLLFNPILGNQDAFGFSFGDAVTALAPINGDTLAVWTRSTIQMIQGQLSQVGSAYQSTISPTSGGIEYSIQPMANFMFADHRGITMIGQSQKYGDFEVGHISAPVAPFLIPRLQLSAFFESANTGLINSVLIRNKNQYRAFFADGYVVTLTYLIDGEEPQFTIQKYFNGANVLTWDVVQAFTETTGRDRIFGATADGTGNVYELERSNTFNGNVIPAYFVLVPDHIQNAQVGLTAWSNKRFQDIHVYGSAQDYGTFYVTRSGTYDALNTQAGNQIPQIFGLSSNVPTGNVSPYVSNSILQIDGRAVNIRIDSGSSTDPSATTPQFPHIIQAVEYDVQPLQPKTT